MSKHSDFGNIIQKRFKKTKKGEECLVSLQVGGEVVKAKIIEAGPDHFVAYVGNRASAGWSDKPRTFNPDNVDWIE